MEQTGKPSYRELNVAAQERTQRVGSGQGVQRKSRRLSCVRVASVASSSPHHRTEPIQPINSHCRYHQVHLPEAYSSGICESFGLDMINVKPKANYRVREPTWNKSQGEKSQPGGTRQAAEALKSSPSIHGSACTDSTGVRDQNYLGENPLKMYNFFLLLFSIQ